MELNINSPAYFTNHYGVDDEVYRYCQNLHNYFKTKEYSETLTIIGITPIVAPKEVYNQGLWKEKVQIVSLGTCAMIDVRMDFESYYNADSDGKIQLIEEMLIKAAFCRVQRTPMRFRADAVQSTTDALKQCIFSYSRGFITTV